MFLSSALALMLIAAAQAPAGSSPAQSSPVQPDAAALERIKESVLTPPALELPDELQTLFPVEKQTPRFRLTIEEETPPPPWEDRSMVPVYVRTPRPSYHHEYLMQVTPEAFRAGMLYPGVDILPAIEAAFDTIADELRDRREAEARRRVRKDLDRLNWFIPN